MEPSQQRNADPRRKAAVVLLPLAVAAVLVATLRPGSITHLDPWGACLLCGSRGTAAGIVNIILFLPFGVALGLFGWGWRRAALAAAALSLSVEITQMGVAGRNPSFGDLLFNTIGGGAGAIAVVLAPLWLRPAPRTAGILSLLAALGAAGVVAGTGLLLAPSYPANTYYGQWTPDLAHLEQYDGEVVNASIGRIPIGPRRLPDSAVVRAALIDRAPLHVTAVAGSRPPDLASLVSIYDADQREIVLLGPDRGDLVFRYRTRSKALLLDQPEIRAPGLARGSAEGDTVTASAAVDGAGHHCLRWGSREACGLGFTAGHGWALLYYKDGFPQWLKRLLGLAWVAILALPFGLWARRRWTTAAGAAVLAGSLILLPDAVGLLAPASEVAAGGAGALAGALVAAVAARRRTNRRR